MLGVPEAQVRQHSLRMPAHRSLQACEAACEHAAHLHTCTPEPDDTRSQTPASQQAASKRHAELAQALGTPARGGTRSAAADARPRASAVGPCRGAARGAPCARACTARHAGGGRARGCRGLWGGPARGARLHDEVHGQQEGEDAQQHHRPQAGLAVAGHEQHDVQQPQRRQEEQQRGDVDARLRRAAPPPLSARVPPGGAGLYGGPRRWASQPARTLSNMDEWTAWMTKTDKALWEWVHDRRWMTAWPGAHARHAAAGHADDGLPAVHLH